MGRAEAPSRFLCGHPWAGCADLSKPECLLTTSSATDVRHPVERRCLDGGCEQMRTGEVGSTCLRGWVCPASAMRMAGVGDLLRGVSCTPPLYTQVIISNLISLCFSICSVFWDLYCAAPERRDTCEHSSEAKAFHDYVSNKFLILAIITGLDGSNFFSIKSKCTANWQVFISSLPSLPLSCPPAFLLPASLDPPPPMC